MKITNIDLILLRAKFAVEHMSSFDTRKYRNAAIVRIQTDEGLYGLGETFVNFPDWAHFERFNTYKDWLTPLLLGEDPLNITHINEMLRKKAKVFGLHWGAVGVVQQAISGIDIALWDIKGKYNCQSVGEMIDKKKNEVPVYISGLSINSYEEFIKFYLEKNVKAFKLKIGLNYEKDIESIFHARQMIGKDKLIMLDANQSLTVKKFLSMKQVFLQNDIYWVEEPLPADDIDGLIEIKKRSDIRIAGGENIYGLSSFEHVIKNRLIDIIQPDITKCGGITETLKIIEIAEKHNIEWTPHFYANGIGLAATLQVISSNTSNSVFLEYAFDPIHPLRDTCITGLPKLNDGNMSCPEGNGIGVELNMDEIMKYQISM